MNLPEDNYIITVSGGVDSIVLLDMLASSGLPHLVVAHFDHGIRADSGEDAMFVGEQAARYELPFEMRREELGATASEAYARERRYVFLRELAQKYQAKMITAHHADDVIETIAINLLRGTGWRGLAVLDSPDIVRPLLHQSKSELIEYARSHHLSWREDSTNASDTYLRNRLRQSLQVLSEDSKRQLLALRDHQVRTKHLVAGEISELLPEAAPYSRYFFTMLPEPAALELLKAVCLKDTGVSPLVSQLRRGLMAIKVAASLTKYDLGGGAFIEFTRANFIVKTSGK